MSGDGKGFSSLFPIFIFETRDENHVTLLFEIYLDSEWLFLSMSELTTMKSLLKSILLKIRSISVSNYQFKLVDGMSMNLSRFFFRRTRLLWIVIHLWIPSWNPMIDLRKHPKIMSTFDFELDDQKIMILSNLNRPMSKICGDSRLILWSIDLRRKKNMKKRMYLFSLI